MDQIDAILAEINILLPEQKRLRDLILTVSNTNKYALESYQRQLNHVDKLLDGYYLFIGKWYVAVQERE
jgi:hypothetical protein